MPSLLVVKKFTADLSGRTNHSFADQIPGSHCQRHHFRHLPTARLELPMTQLKLVADLIAPFLTEIFNRLLSTATVPTLFRVALITPLLKKTRLRPC